MMLESSLKSSPRSSNTYSDEQIHEQKDGTIVPLWNFHNTLSKTPMNKDFQEISLADAGAGARIRPRDINLSHAKVDCRDYEKGRCLGNCDGMGHYQCDVCKWRKPKKERNYE